MLCVLVIVFYETIYNDNWLFGNGCLYDDGNGFYEMENEEQIELENGKVVKCKNGNLIFE